MPDWRDADDYRFTDGLTRDQWGWEFLRRNPDYQREWARFDALWRALEADYGRAPNRDFHAWKRDPRAYVVVAEDEAGDGCRIDQDRVLIECALGARWGFYKFPLSPDTDNPLPPERLAWREQPSRVRRLTGSDSGYLGDDPARIALGFDLDLPLRDQLEQAKRYLLARQQRLRREGRLQMRTVAKLREDWRLALRLLDAEAAGVSLDEIAGTLFGGDTETARHGLEEARRLRDGGYLEIVKLPEG
ncbi:DUF6499 domain-containing protein [Thiohalobacter sp. IOR34]|uniref:transcriptional regulator domain-containing protein n=1 Tax=Thiohalobacter sp. IOR34 TaxID=3057176 RepID=UPI0025B1EBBE|nr:DUF6499 domain-containing protein [Thiohalobacter sp. IOR34]WJW75169.1 DUF6499 domain-containing protein [Thiohalobacter sp. IOR34]